MTAGHMSPRVHQNSKKFSKSHGLLIYFVPTWTQAISAKNIKKTQNAKQLIFLAEMACTHVGTKYIKRP